MAGQARAEWDCTAYGDFAMRDIAKAEAAQCGFSGPRWSADEGMHYGFCVERLGAGDDNAMTVETDARMRDVAGCEKKFGARVLCPDYARQASQAVKEAATLGCNFNGPRWSADEGLHFGYCSERTSAGDMNALASESDARRADLAECKLAKNAPDPLVVPPPPPPGNVQVLAAVTGYAVRGGPDSCYFAPPDTAQLIKVDDADQSWLFVKGTSGGCLGQEVWVYNGGELKL
jgi:hypothetical protein